MVLDDGADDMIRSDVDFVLHDGAEDGVKFAVLDDGADDMIRSDVDFVLHDGADDGVKFEVMLLIFGAPGSSLD